MDRFTQLETYIAVIESGSLSAAAKRLGIAVSAVSRRIDELETRLGVRLAQRSTRGFAPTAIGSEYFEHARDMLEQLAEGEARTRGDQAALRGTVRLAAPLTFGVAHVTPIVSEMMADTPDLVVELNFNDRRVDLVSEGIDLALRIGRLDDSALIARRLFGVRHVVAASPDYWDTYRRPETAQDLATHRALSYRSGAVGASWRYRDPNGRDDTVTLQPRLIATNGDALVMAAKRGLGVLMEPTFICGDAIRAGDLEPVLLDHTWMSLSAYLVYAPGRALPARVRHVMDQLIRQLSEPTPWDRGI
ncbi:MAG: LysR family transcriptional regulator [Henriciella sp.]|nr:LysR family transcriptional regulator [Henriciella sp.]